MKRRRNQRGYGLGGTMIFLVLVALIWEGIFFQMASYLRAEKALSEWRMGELGCTRAMAWSLALLETGVPPENPYICRMAPMGDSSQMFVATFRRAGRSRYTVSVRPIDIGDEFLPIAPAAFGSRRP